MTTDKLIVSIRQRHNLAEDTPVMVKARSAAMDVDEGDPYKFTARITTAALDRDDEVLLPTGMDPSEFDVSGAIFWNHSYDQPIGVGGPLKRSERDVSAEASFLKRPDDHVGAWFPDFARAFVQQMAKAGKRVGVSVGFIPTEMRKPSKKDRDAYGDRVRSVVSKWRLLEWSIAPVQANPEAVITSVGKHLEPAAFKALFPGMPVPPREVTIAVKPQPVRKYLVVIPAKRKPKPKSQLPREVRVLAKAVAKQRGQLWC